MFRGEVLSWLLAFATQAAALSATSSHGVSSTVSTVPAASSTVQPPVTTTVYNAQATVVPTSGAKFPAVGSVSRDYSPAGLEKLWDIVGPVEKSPFTTTKVPSLPIPVPSPPPALYPSWFAPEPKDILPQYKLPKGFKFGVATAAYQVEGAVKDEGKGPTLWDWNSRQPGGVIDNTTGDVVDLQYFLYKEDVARVAALGFNAHSFSISWARVFPFGTADSPVNQAALDHYSDLIDYHNKMGVEPVATLFHWDTPVSIQAYYGGFQSGEVVGDFVHYAKTVFKAYNGRVKTWYTFNEPRVYCGEFWGYPFSATLPSNVTTIAAFYTCNYNVLRAHAGAVKAFRELKIQGEIAFKNDDFVGIPWRANNTEDIEAVERHAAFQIGIYSDPVYTTGDWPKRLTDTLPPSILPRFTEAEKKDLLGSADFFAIDSYRTSYVAAPDDGLAACINNTAHPLWPSCQQSVLYDSKAGWAAGISPDPLSETWLQATPNFLRDGLKQLQKRWPTKKMYVAEFGFVEAFEHLRSDLFRITEDVARTNYFMTYLGEILRAIHEDNLPIAGTFAWAMVDNAEWSSGLSARFGIQHVNYTSLERTYKRSAFALCTSSGFGKRLVNSALRRGDRVIATARSVQKLEELHKDLDEDLKKNLRTLEVDITAGEDVLKGKLDEAAAFWGQIDVLVNNAGIGFPGLVEEGGSKLLRKQFETNVFGVIDVTTAALPHLRKNKEATLVMIGSRSAWKTELPGLGPYASSKAAIHAITETLTTELAQFGIRTLLVAPGAFRTENIYGQDYHTSNAISAYDDLRTRSHIRFKGVAGTEKGDPDKAMEVVIDVVRGEGVAKGRTWPGLLVLGSDAESELVARYNKVLKSVEEWKDISHSCNFD